MASEAFGALVDTVNVISDAVINSVTAIISVNYELVSAIISVVTAVWSVIVKTCLVVHGICSGISMFTLDLLSEIFNIFCFLLWVIQGTCRIILQVLSLGEYLFYPAEVLVYSVSAVIRWLVAGICSCTVAIFSNVLTSVVMTYGGVKMGFTQVFESFDKIGSSIIWVLGSALQSCYDGIILAYATFVDVVWYTASGARAATEILVDETGKYLVNTYINIYDSLTVEVYCGIGVLIVLYMAVISLKEFVAENGLTFPSVFQNNDIVNDIPEGLNILDDDDSETESVASANSDVDDLDNDESDAEREFVIPATHNLKKRPPTPARETCSTSRSSKDLEYELENEREKRLCVICQDQVKNVLLLPCKHLCACVDCANQLLNAVQVNRRVCPLCRSPIRQVIDVYT